MINRALIFRNLSYTTIRRDMTNTITQSTLDKLEVVDRKTGGTEIKLRDTDNYVSIKLDEDGSIRRIHIDVVGLTENPILLKR